MARGRGRGRGRGRIRSEKDLSADEGTSSSEDEGGDGLGAAFFFKRFSFEARALEGGRAYALSERELLGFSVRAEKLG